MGSVTVVFFMARIAPLGGSGRLVTHLDTSPPSSRRHPIPSIDHGSVDAAFALAGFPTSAVVQASATNELQFIELPPEMMQALLETYPYYSEVSVPADVYGTDAPITVIGSANMLITHADADAGLVATVAEAVYGHLDDLIDENALAAQIVPEASLELPIPLHQGAIEYFGQ